MLGNKQCPCRMKVMKGAPLGRAGPNGAFTGAHPAGARCSSEAKEKSPGNKKKQVLSSWWSLL
jgi:hypothetical protein